MNKHSHKKTSSQELKKQDDSTEYLGFGILIRKDALKWVGTTVSHCLQYLFSIPRKHSSKRKCVHLGEGEGRGHGIFGWNPVLALPQQNVVLGRTT